MKRGSSFLSTILFGLFSIIAFLIILWIANITKDSISSQIFSSIVIFFNTNLKIIIAISLLFLLAKISDLFPAPVNLFGPFFNAVGAGFLIVFLLKILKLSANLAGFSFSWIFGKLDSLVVPIIFFVASIIFIVGYIKLLVAQFKNKKSQKENKKEDGKLKKPVHPTWADIGHQFKLMLHDIIIRKRNKISKN